MAVQLCPLRVSGIERASSSPRLCRRTLELDVFAGFEEARIRALGTLPAHTPSFFSDGSRTRPQRAQCEGRGSGDESTPTTGSLTYRWPRRRPRSPSIQDLDYLWGAPRREWSAWDEILEEEKRTRFLPTPHGSALEALDGTVGPQDASARRNETDSRRGADLDDRICPLVRSLSPPMSSVDAASLQSLSPASSAAPPVFLQRLHGHSGRERFGSRCAKPRAKHWMTRRELLPALPE
ncbi:hypothetical protein DFH09DRAFT_1359795 [Mycena vulgaris]|nr:hypothetical protein DFH09DRAFT_1359795 [Mycena vulgaris]